MFKPGPRIELASYAIEVCALVSPFVSGLALTHK